MINIWKQFGNKSIDHRGISFLSEYIFLGKNAGLDMSIRNGKIHVENNWDYLEQIFEQSFSHDNRDWKIILSQKIMAPSLPSFSSLSFHDKMLKRKKKKKRLEDSILRYSPELKLNSDWKTDMACNTRILACGTRRQGIRGGYTQVTRTHARVES